MLVQQTCRRGLVLILLTLCAGANLWAVEQTAQPNILLIVADDIGYSDLGAYGSEIATPNLDRLASEGLMLTNFYVSPNCSPTRAMLMSGTDHHLAGLGNMIEQLAPEQEGRAGYEGGLNDRVAPLPALLRDAGYHTYMAGKWHLGGGEGFDPSQRGFERSFMLVQGGAAHFRQKAPTGLWSGGPNARYRENGTPVELDQLPEDFYSSTFYTDKLIEYIDADREDGKPFFAYAAYTAPHWPLQAPNELLEKYRGQYDMGYDELARQRFARMQELGLLPANAAAPAPRLTDMPAWDDLSDEDRAREARIMETYAAMIDKLDQEIGRLLAHLDTIGELDNTFIFFVSDNGPEGNDLGADADNDVWVPANFDNSLDNIGRPDSYVWLGKGWGQVSAQPWRFFKAFPTEGGMRVPAFAYFPEAVQSGRSAALATVKDILPTLLELAGTRHPGIDYQGRTVMPIQGLSMLPHLLGETDTVHNDDYVIAMELFGRRGLRKGDWKLEYFYPPYGKEQWELYNLARDPAEQQDLAARETGKLNELLIEWREYVEHNNVISLDQDFGYPRKNY